MSKPRPGPGQTRPPIVLKQSDCERLIGVAVDGLLSAPRDAGALLQEISRAVILDDAEVDAGVAVLDSTVVFVADDAEAFRQGRLVLRPDPGQAEPQIPALSNLGAGLLGLRVGQTISWPDRLGGRRELTLLDVRPPGGDADVGDEAPRPDPEPDGAGEVVPFRRPPPPAQADHDPPPTAA